MEETEGNNHCRVCSVLIEAWFAYCESHAEGYCPRCGAKPEEDCTPGCPNEVKLPEVDADLQGRP